MRMVEKMAMAMDAAVLRYILAHEEKAKNDPTIIPWIGMADVPMDILARAAIEAMREPTEEMIDAAEHDGGHSLYRYQAMIDKAIQESGE